MWFCVLVTFRLHNTGGLASNFLVWCNVAITKCLPAQLQPSWPCSRNRDMNASLTDALIMSRLLIEQVSNLLQNMVILLFLKYIF